MATRAGQFLRAVTRNCTGVSSATASTRSSSTPCTERWLKTSSRHRSQATSSTSKDIDPQSNGESPEKSEWDEIFGSEGPSATLSKAYDAPALNEEVPTVPSAYEDIFSGDDPFPKADPSYLHGRRPGANFPKLRRVPQQPRDRSGQRFASDAESVAWSKLLEDMSRMSSSQSYGQASTSRSFAGFQNRVRDQSSLRSEATRRKRATLADGFNRLAALAPEGEGPMEISVQDLDLGVDRAVEAMRICQTEADLWDWASREIWGFDAAAYRMDIQQRRRMAQVAARRAESKQKTEGITETLYTQTDDNDATLPESRRTQQSPLVKGKYGPATPFYAAVIHRLFLEFRDRFESPQSALVVPFVARSLGTSSWVLATTQELYATVIETQWDYFRDIRSVLATLKEAREAGLDLSSQLIRYKVDRIRSEARQGVLSRRTPEMEESDSGLGLHGKTGGGDSDLQATSWPMGQLDLADRAKQPSLTTMTTTTSIDVSTLPLSALDTLRLTDRLDRLVSRGTSSAGGQGRRDASTRRGTSGNDRNWDRSRPQRTGKYPTAQRRERQLSIQRTIRESKATFDEDEELLGARY